MNLLQKLASLEGFTGSYVFINGEVEKEGAAYRLDGFWEYMDGGEGGDLNLWYNQTLNEIEVLDFDGAYDLPPYVKNELKVLDISCNWDN